MAQLARRSVAPGNDQVSGTSQVHRDMYRTKGSDIKMLNESCYRSVLLSPEVLCKRLAALTLKTKGGDAATFRTILPLSSRSRLANQRSAGPTAVICWTADKSDKLLGDVPRRRAIWI